MSILIPNLAFRFFLGFYVLILALDPTPALAAVETHLDWMKAFSQFGDVMRSGLPGLPGLDDWMKDPALTAVTREFGATVIPARAYPFRSPVAQANQTPWSSWWYPKRDGFFINDAGPSGLSVMSKYDLYRNRQKGSFFSWGGAPSYPSAAEFERNNYNPQSQSWEGLCDAWSIAAISRPEPKHPVMVSVGSSQVVFQVSELKALLLKTYEAVDESNFNYYGQRFTGDDQGWVFPDVFPDQFHRFIEVQLFERKQAFIMDHDPGVQVWNVPVYKANFLMDSVADDPDAVFVRLWLYSAEPVQAAEKEFVGKRDTIREYDYVLKGTRNNNGELVVNSGYWVKGPDGVDSRKDHPDFFTVIRNPATLVRKSWNPGIDIGVVDEIVSKSY